MGTNVLIINGHPADASLCHALAQQYEQGAVAAGHQVRHIALGQLAFDPILRQGFHGPQPLEPDLQAAQSDILWAQHLVFVYPIWWGGMPALLKGFIDRTFLPGFAFKYRSDSPFPEQLLKGRTADMLVTMDTPPWYFRWVYGNPGHWQMKRTILQFTGIRPVKVHSMGPVRSASDSKKQGWLTQAFRLGQRISGGMPRDQHTLKLADRGDEQPRQYPPNPSS
jgi:NAD(P)H dehydrogenase (quinone)